MAEALSYSPSSVSVQLAELEREAGAPLLRRSGRTLELTPAGARLAEHAAQALTVDEAVRAELAQLSGKPRGVVRMTFVQTPALALLRTALRELAEPRPNCASRSHSETAPALADLRSRAVDLVVGVDYDPVPVARHRDVDREDLIREAVLLCVPTDHPLARASGPISLSGFEHAAWAADFPGSGHRTALEHLCNRLGGYAPDVRHHTDDALILRALVASGQAVTILAALIATATPQVAARPIAEGAVHRTIFTAARTSAVDAPAIQAVRTALRNAARAATAGREDVKLLGG